MWPRHVSASKILPAFKRCCYLPLPSPSHQLYFAIDNLTLRLLDLVHSPTFCPWDRYWLLVFLRTTFVVAAVFDMVM